MNEKGIINNVYNYLRTENPSGSVDDIVAKTSNMTGVSEAKTGVVKSANKNAGGRKKVEFTEEIKNEIGRKVHEFYFRKEIPTLSKISDEMNKDPYYPKMGRAKLWELKVKWAKHNRKAILINTDEIICWRRRYLITIFKLRAEGKPIFCLYETWVNEGYTFSKMWQDTNI